MKSTIVLAILGFALGTAVFQSASVCAVPLGTAFTYQGQLMDGEKAADGIYDLVFVLCETPEGPTELAARVIEDLEVVDGFLSVELDFGDVFDGNERWLQIEVRPGESVDPAEWTVLSPRRPITPTPYAIYAKTAGQDGDWMVSGNDMYSIPPGNIGVGTNTPSVPLDVRRANPGGNQVAALFTNPSDAAGSQVSIDLALGTNLPTAWRLRATSGSLLIGNATVASPAMGIDSSHHVGITNGLTVSSSDDVAVYAGAGTIPLILITGKHGVVAYGEDYGVMAWGGKKAGYFEGDVFVNGNLGIGTDKPQEKLHVAGLARFDLGAGRLVMSTPGGWPGIISYSANGHRRDIIVDDSGLRFLTSSSSSPAPAENGITIRENGNVGVGTSSPLWKLDVHGEIRASDQLLASNNDGAISLVPFLTYSTINAQRNSPGVQPADLSLATNGGNVGIGTTNPGSYKLAVNGSAAKPGGGSWSYFSDIRLKEIDGDYEAGLSEVSKLDPVRYSYKEDGELRLPADKEFVGVVAQQVERVIPEAVEENDEGYLMVNNDPIIWAMVNAIKELRTQNQELKQRVEALEGMVRQHRFDITKEVQQ